MRSTIGKAYEWFTGQAPDPALIAALDRRLPSAALATVSDEEADELLDCIARHADCDQSDLMAIMIEETGLDRAVVQSFLYASYAAGILAGLGEHAVVPLTIEEAYLTIVGAAPGAGAN